MFQKSAKLILKAAVVAFAFVVIITAQHAEIVDPHGITVVSTEGVCYRHVPHIAWSFGITDSIITACYFLIPAGLVEPLRRLPKTIARPLKIFGLWLCAFVASCGMTHAISVGLLFFAIWNLAIYANIVTAISSVGAVVYLFWKARPVLIRLAVNINKLAKMPNLGKEILEIRKMAEILFDDSLDGKTSKERFDLRLKKVEINIKEFEEFREAYTDPA